jgi:hypothetical protein
MLAWLSALLATAFPRPSVMLNRCRPKRPNGKRRKEGGRERGKVNNHLISKLS